MLRWQGVPSLETATWSPCYPQVVPPSESFMMGGWLSTRFGRLLCLAFIQVVKSEVMKKEHGSDSYAFVLSCTSQICCSHTLFCWPGRGTLWSGSDPRFLAHCLEAIEEILWSGLRYSRSKDPITSLHWSDTIQADSLPPCNRNKMCKMGRECLHLTTQLVLVWSGDNCLHSASAAGQVSAEAFETGWQQRGYECGGRDTRRRKSKTVHKIQRGAMDAYSRIRVVEIWWSKVKQGSRQWVHTLSVYPASIMPLLKVSIKTTI